MAQQQKQSTSGKSQGPGSYQGASGSSASGEKAPANLDKYLQGLNFPAKKQNLMDLAKSKGANKTLLDSLSQMPNKDYVSLDDVMKTFSKSH